MKITLRHVRSLGYNKGIMYCVPGMKRFAQKYDIDFREFVKEGIDEEVFLATGDTMGIAVVEEARRLEQEGGE